MTQDNHDYRQIPGWGMDADQENDPTYPIKNWTGDDHDRINWERPELQKTNLEVLHSNERPSKSAVYGTTVPPSGLSGQIRRYAFNFSENSYGHWLPLLLADRINVVEGLIEDVKNEGFPNIWAEKGGRAAWSHDRAGVVLRTAGTLALLGLAGWMLLRSKKR